MNKILVGLVVLVSTVFVSGCTASPTQTQIKEIEGYDDAIEVPDMIDSADDSAEIRTELEKIESEIDSAFPDVDNADFD